MKKIGIICKPKKSEVISILTGGKDKGKGLLKWLGDKGIEIFLDKGIEIFLDEDTTSALQIKGYSRNEIAKLVDMVIVLGGDGTMLSVARLVCEKDIPILGVNLGSLGFITEIQALEIYDALEKILEGNCNYEERLMLNVSVTRQKEKIAEHTVLNDVVINKGAIARMIDLEIFIDKKYLSEFKADGLIISTATGSTAYSLSAGGPILYPTLENIIITPICPHMLTNRPLVIPGDSEVKTTLKAKSGEVVLTLDGQSVFTIKEGDVIAVKKSPFKAKLIMPYERDYYQTLRSRLKWGER
jgi:NAD+ kinase